MENKVVEYAHLMIKLLQEVVYDEEKTLWNDLLTYQIPVRDYFAKIGVELHLDEREGFAFLTQPDADAAKLPRLVRRIPLSYDVTLLCVVLRDVLEEFDVGDIESRKCFISGQEIREKMSLFFREQPNTVKLLEKLDKTIQAAVRLGFLKPTNPENTESEESRYEIRRIIKAKITNAKLEEIKRNLEAYNYKEKR